ncbi:hypothetical protein BN874_840027 [Candidatus Contendobacter odensis Run_B_J11]|uniref:Transposase n=1 Tax=Candidatus Contendobacter odensis Run_B_J11 TaxID=1400861 RepID=A0A7U7GFP9_9GAMM|nr:hypothetical protein BN874_840027 [Candidatus Contendobacter odensis Run_B_J11]
MQSKEFHRDLVELGDQLAVDKMGLLDHKVAREIQTRTGRGQFESRLYGRTDEEGPFGDRG